MLESTKFFSRMVPLKRLNNITRNDISYFSTSDKTKNGHFICVLVPVRIVTRRALKIQKCERRKKKKKDAVSTVEILQQFILSRWYFKNTRARKTGSKGGRFAAGARTPPLRGVNFCKTKYTNFFVHDSC